MSVEPCPLTEMRERFQTCEDQALDLYPTNLQLSNNSLLLSWSDGVEQAISFQDLRDRCPCATCAEKRTSKDQASPNPLSVISKSEAAPVSIKGMAPVGSYAYSVQFSDGHSTGIFTLEFLRSLVEA